MRGVTAIFDGERDRGVVAAPAQSAYKSADAACTVKRFLIGFGEQDHVGGVGAVFYGDLSRLCIAHKAAYDVSGVVNGCIASDVGYLYRIPAEGGEFAGVNKVFALVGVDHSGNDTHGSVPGSSGYRAGFVKYKILYLRTAAKYTEKSYVSVAGVAGDLIGFCLGGVYGQIAYRMPLTVERSPEHTDCPPVIALGPAAERFKVFYGGAVNVICQHNGYVLKMVFPMYVLIGSVICSGFFIAVGSVDSQNFSERHKLVRR